MDGWESSLGTGLEKHLKRVLNSPKKSFCCQVQGASKKNVVEEDIRLNVFFSQGSSFLPSKLRRKRYLLAEDKKIQLLEKGGKAGKKE